MDSPRSVSEFRGVATYGRLLSSPIAPHVIKIVFWDSGKAILVGSLEKHVKT